MLRDVERRGRAGLEPGICDAQDIRKIPNRVVRNAQPLACQEHVHVCDRDFGLDGKLYRVAVVVAADDDCLRRCHPGPIAAEDVEVVGERDLCPKVSVMDSGAAAGFCTRERRVGAASMAGKSDAPAIRSSARDWSMRCTAAAMSVLSLLASATRRFSVALRKARHHSGAIEGSAVVDFVVNVGGIGTSGRKNSGVSVEHAAASDARVIAKRRRSSTVVPT